MQSKGDGAVAQRRLPGALCTPQGAVPAPGPRSALGSAPRQRHHFVNNFACFFLLRLGAYKKRDF